MSASEVLEQFSQQYWRKETKRSGTVRYGPGLKQKAGKWLVTFPVRGPHFLQAGNMETLLNVTYTSTGHLEQLHIADANSLCL